MLELHALSVRAMRLEQRLLKLKVLARKGEKVGIALAYYHAGIIARKRSEVLSDAMFQLCIDSLFAAVAAHHREQLNSEEVSIINIFKHHLETKKMNDLALARISQAYSCCASQ